TKATASGTTIRLNGRRSPTTLTPKAAVGPMSIGRLRITAQISKSSLLGRRHASRGNARACSWHCETAPRRSPCAAHCAAPDLRDRFIDRSLQIAEQEWRAWPPSEKGGPTKRGGVGKTI